MGQLVSHTVGERNGVVGHGTNDVHDPEIVPAPPRSTVQVAETTDGVRGEAYATARTVDEEGEMRNERAPSFNRLPQVESEDDGARAKCFVFMVFLVAIIAFTMTNNREEEPETLGIRPSSATVVVCPPVFDDNNETVAIAGCKSDGCGGFIEWCALNDNNTYRLTLEIAGDYNLVQEELFVNFSAAEYTVTAAEQCEPLEEVLITDGQPSGGVLRLDYRNSPEVGDICDSDYAGVMRATLKQL